MSEIRWSAARAGNAALICKTKGKKFRFLPWHLSPRPPRCSAPWPSPPGPAAPGRGAGCAPGRGSLPRINHRGEQPSRGRCLVIRERVPPGLSR